MKKKNISVSHPKYLGNNIRKFIVFILWVLSIILSFYLIAVFGLRLNRPYDKEKEEEYQKQLDIVCYTILSVWGLSAILVIIFDGPLFLIMYALRNIVYISLTLAIITIWLKRAYKKNKTSRNFLVFVAIWNIIMILIGIGFRSGSIMSCKKIKH
jgi:magnesium-transporting ATPase (P-type)